MKRWDPSDFEDSGEAPPPPDQPIEFGSPAHKVLFSRTLLDTFDPYRPAVIDWPELEPDALARITSLPIWDIAVQTEGKASTRVLAYAERVGDPLLKRAVELNGFEEARHKHVLSNLVQAYGIRLQPEPAYKTRAMRSGPSWSRVFRSVSTASSPSACSRRPSAQAISRPN